MRCRPGFTGVTVIIVSCMLSVIRQLDWKCSAGRDVASVLQDVTVSNVICDVNSDKSRRQYSSERDAAPVSLDVTVCKVNCDVISDTLVKKDGVRRDAAPVFLDVTASNVSCDVISDS